MEGMKELPSVHSWMVVGFEFAADSFNQTLGRNNNSSMLSRIDGIDLLLKARMKVEPDLSY